MNSNANILPCNTLYSCHCLLSPRGTANLVLVTRSCFQDDMRTKAKPVNYIYTKKSINTDAILKQIK